MIHLFKENDEGGKLISRYYMGENLSIELGNHVLRLPGLIKRLIVKDQSARLQLAFEQLMHDQIEFTNLTSFLPSLYREFGSD